MPSGIEGTAGDRAESRMIPRSCKRLAEVDFPISVVSKHAAREKSIRHGHPLTLHLWWARRPLASSRAVLLAPLLPDPCDLHCPVAFKRQAAEILGALRQSPTNDAELRQALLWFILKARKLPGFSQLQLAAGTSNTRPLLSMVEHGRANLSVANLTAAAKALGVSVDFLCGLTTDPTPARQLAKELADMATRARDLEEQQAFLAAADDGGDYVGVSEPAGAAGASAAFSSCGPTTASS